jgi:hypothetical protein
MLQSHEILFVILISKKVRNPMDSKIYNIFIISILFLVIFLSSTPLPIKFFMAAMSIVFFVPKIRSIVFGKKMIQRKIKAAIYTSIIFTLFWLCGITIFYKSLEFENLSLVLFVFFFSLVGNFSYGLSVSILSEFIITKLTSYRVLTSCLIHIGFGLLTYFIFVFELFIFCTSCSIIFFVMDVLLRRKENSPTILQKKKYVAT